MMNERVGNLDNLLFDLDGTLVDTSEGILNSAKYALDRLGIVERDPDMLYQFIGPPLKDTFLTQYGLDDTTSTKAVETFREYYRETGIHQCRLYRGIPETLKSLRSSGFRLFVATSKPTLFSETILNTLGIAQEFQEIVGSNLDNTRSRKCEIIQHILDANSEFIQNAFVMIGDKSQDLIGAQQCGIPAIGVTYGFGTYDELNQHSHIAIVASPMELLDVLQAWRINRG